MAETLKIPKGQPFALYVPLVILNADGTKESVDAVSLTNVAVVVSGPDGPASGIETSTYEHFLILKVPATLSVADYAVVITADLSSGRKFALRHHKAFSVVNWDFQSNWRDYIVGDHLELTDQPFIAGYAVNDAELDALKAELRIKIAAAESAKEAADASKAAYDRKAEQLDDVAKEQTLTQGVADIRDDISHIDIDTSTLAKETSVKDGNDTAISVGKDVRSEVGTGSDTAAETGTLFAIVKWVKDKVKSIANYIGTPESGQPSTLFAAIAAGGSGGGSTPSEVVDDSVSSKALDPNKLYIFTNRTSNLTITLNAGQSGEVNEYQMFIEVGNSTPTIIWPSGLTWVAPLTLTISTSVQISILNNSVIWL